MKRASGPSDGLLAGLLLLLALIVAIPGGVAARGGSDKSDSSDAGHLCQQGGWQGLRGEDGERFASTDDCVTYASQGDALAVLNPRIEITFSPTSNSNYCLVDVHLRDLTPLAGYAVENMVRVAASGQGEHVRDITVTTDETGNADYSLSSFAQGDTSTGPRQVLTQTGAISSGWGTISC
jgi:hypothetical protein